MHVIKPEAAESNKSTNEKPKKEGYFICRVFNDERYEPLYLCTFVVDGENGIVCAWEKGKVGNVDYYVDKMAIFLKLRQAETITQLIYREGPMQCAIFYRKWDPVIKRYVTIMTNELKLRRFFATYKSKLYRST